MKKQMFLTVLLFSFTSTLGAEPVRLKNISSIRGVRGNQLLGYGLVVGLNGTGDSKAEFTDKSIARMMKQLGVDIEAGSLNSRNIASVLVTANLPPFSKAGGKLDVIVSSVGDAKNLSGGTLVLTPLRAADQNVYAVAQGAVIVGGYSASNSSNKSSIQKSHPTVGMVPNGANIEKDMKLDFENKKSIMLSLENADFTTIARVTRIINADLGGKYAEALDTRTIEITIPFHYQDNVIEFIASIENLEVTTDQKAKVVINEKTGTIVIGNHVIISPIALAHGALTIEIIESTLEEDKKTGLSSMSASSQIKIKEKERRFNILEGAKLEDIVKAFNALGVTPQDITAILQAIKTAGALQAELEII